VADDKTRILTADEARRLAAASEPADDKTRVLSADEAGRILAAAKPVAKGAAAKAPKAAPTRSPEPQVVDGKIIFFCSRGHRIVVDAEFAGKKGNCSKAGCGVPVVIPVPPDSSPAPKPSSLADIVVTDSDSTAAEAVPEPPAETPVFDLGAPVAAAEPVAQAAEPEPPAFDFSGGEPGVAAPALDLGFEGPAVAGDWAADLAEIDNPTARLVARLWLERAHGGVVEVHLSGGSVIMPEWFDARWSSGTHALFAAQAADGTITLTAVAWDQIQKVVVRQVQGTPDGMFEA
jgi:hypothetical protein